MKYFAPTLYNMATVIQSCICILSKLSCAQSLFNHLRIYVTLYFLLRHDSVRASTQMLPACLSLLILNAAFSLLFFRTCACFGRDPLASPLPLSPPEQTAPCRMDFLYTMPHCVLTPFLDTSGDLRTKTKKKRKKNNWQCQGDFSNHQLTMPRRLGCEKS